MEQTVTLLKGITIGGDAQTNCVIREASVADLAAAAEDAASVEMAPTGRHTDSGYPTFEPMKVINPYLMELHTLRRQIVRVGDIDGPLDADMHWPLLSESDLELIKREADAMAAVKTAPSEVVLRGRSDGQSESGQAAE